MRISRTFRRVVYGLAILAALLVLTLGIMSTPWFQRFLERQIILGLQDLTGGRAEVAQFQFRPFIFQIRFRGFVIHGKEPLGALPLLSARDITIGLSPTHLLHRHIRLRSLDADHVEVHLRTSPDGTTNIPGAKAAGPQQQQILKDLIDLSVGRLNVSHSGFFWNDQEVPLDLSARELALLVRLARGNRYLGSLSSSDTSIRSPHWSPTPLRFSSRFELTREEFTVSSLTWQARGITGNASLTLRVLAIPEMGFSFHSTLDVPVFASTLGVQDLRGGTLQVEGQGAYRDGRLLSQGRVQARQIHFQSAQLDTGRVNASASYTLKQQQVDLRDLMVTIWGGSVRGRASVCLAEGAPRASLHAEIHGVKLAEALQGSSSSPNLFGRLNLASTVDGIADATAAGNFAKLDSSFNLHFSAPPESPDTSLPFGGVAQGTFSRNREYRLNLTQARFQTPHSTLTVQGSLGEAPSPSGVSGGLTVQLKTTDFEEWRPLAESFYRAPGSIPLVLRSAASFTAQISGSTNRPNFAGRLDIGEFEYRGWTWDRLTADVVLSPEVAQVKSARLEHENSSLNLAASAELYNWQLTAESAVHLAAHARRTPLLGLEAALGSTIPIRGTISGDLDLDGTPESLEGSGAFRVEQGSVYEEPFDSFSTKLRATKSAWELENIHLAKGHGLASGRLSLEPAKHYFSGELHGEDFLLTEFKHLAPSTSKSGSAGDVQGRLSFDFNGQGTQEDLRLQGTCDIRQIRLSKTDVGDFHGKITGQGRQLQLQGEVQGPAGIFQVSGHASSEGEWPMEVRGQYSQLRLDPWIRTLLNHKFSPTVISAGSFHLAGALRQPSQIEIQADAQTLEVSFPNLTWRNAQPFQVRYADHRLIASRFQIRGPSTELEVEGSLRFGEHASLNVIAQGTADATLLSLADPNLNATGRSQIKLRLSGTPSQPVMNGTISVEDVSLSYGDMPLRLSGLNGTIQLQGARAVATSLRAVSGGGTVTLGGFVTLTDNPRYELRATLDQLRVQYPSDFTSVLSGNLRLAGSPNHGQLNGDLVLRQIFVSANINWLAKVAESSSGFSEQGPTFNSPIASKIRLNVRVSSAAPVRLETRDLRLVGDVDVRIQGTLANPVQVGAIHFISGEAVFRGNRYQLTRGDVNLTNPFRTQPVLDLEAQTRLQRYDLTLDISGPIDRLRFAYRSDPPLPTADILSLLALGYSRREEELSVAGGNAFPTVGASALLSEALSSQVSGRITRLFGVSRIKIDPNVGAPGLGAGARVTIEQQVTRDVTLTYVTNTASSQYRIIQFEWAVTDSISLLGIRDQNGIFGIEVKFRQRFR